MPDLLFPEFYCEPIHDSDVWEDRTVAVPTFMWNQVVGAVTYTIQVVGNKLQVASDHSFSINLKSYDRINNTVYAPDQIPTAVALGAFWWRVCGYNGNNHFVGCEAYYIERCPEKVYLPAVLRGR